jgi:hypothetical protein
MKKGKDPDPVPDPDPHKNMRIRFRIRIPKTAFLHSSLPDIEASRFLRKLQKYVAHGTV